MKENQLATIPHWTEVLAGIANEEAPVPSKAVATTLGISLTCAAAALDTVQPILLLTSLKPKVIRNTCDTDLLHFVKGILLSWTSRSAGCLSETSSVPDLKHGS